MKWLQRTNLRIGDTRCNSLPRGGGGLGWGRWFSSAQSSLERATPTPTLPQLGGGRKRSVFVRTILLLLLATLALAPAACGKKGAPVLPEGKTDQFPHRYPQSTEPQQGVFN
jgi:predicted small lipoprotein YifL